MASACAFVSVAMVGVVTLSHGRLAVPNTPPQPDEPSLRETMRDDSAEQTLKDRAPGPFSAAKDRLGSNSEGVGATASAPQANETAAARVTQATIGLTNGAPSGSTPEVSDPTGATPPPAPPAQPSGYKLAPADRTATATSSLGPPAQSLDQAGPHGLATASPDSDVWPVPDRRLVSRPRAPTDRQARAKCA